MVSKQPHQISDCRKSKAGKVNETLELARSKKHENKESVRNKIVKKVTNS